MDEKTIFLLPFTMDLLGLNHLLLFTLVYTGEECKLGVDLAHGALDVDREIDYQDSGTLIIAALYTLIEWYDKTVT